MKVRILLLLIIFGSNIFASDFGFTLPSFVNVRESNSTNSDILGQLKRGTLVQLIYQNGDWWRISNNNYSGYIHKNCLFNFEDYRNNPDNKNLVKTVEAKSYEGQSFTINQIEYKEHIPVYIAVFPNLLPRDDDIIMRQMVNLIDILWGNKSVKSDSYYLDKDGFITLLGFKKDRLTYKFLFVKDEYTARIGVVVFWCQDNNGNKKNSQYITNIKKSDTYKKQVPKEKQYRLTVSNLETYLYSEYNRHGVIDVEADKNNPLVILHVNKVLYAGFLVDKESAYTIFNSLLYTIKKTYKNDYATIYIYYLDKKVIRADQYKTQRIDVKYYE